jgi:hypothetical protein
MRHERRVFQDNFLNVNCYIERLKRTVSLKLITSMNSTNGKHGESFFSGRLHDNSPFLYETILSRNRKILFYIFIGISEKMTVSSSLMRTRLSS